MKVRVRQDLEFYPVEGYRDAAWVVRDPLTMTCYQLGEEEYFLLSRLNQAASLEELRQQFERSFAPRQLTSSELQSLLADWLKKRLLLGDPLLLARWERESKTGGAKSTEDSFWKRVVRNPLAIRFRGWDPQRFLEVITPWCAWIYTWEWAVCSLLLGLLALSLAWTHSPAILEDLQQLPLLFGPEQWLMVAVCVSVTKILHEFGHAITCHYFGGRCHEMGLLLLVGIPCLYCNVTDAWTFPKRWQRVAVSGAGIAVDLWIASLCLLLWHFSEPGVWHSIFLLLAVFGSVNSLLLNGNPLMRYDGYYLFSDLAGIANLRSQALLQTRSLFWRGLMGTAQSDRQEPLEPGMISYGLLAGIYLWAILLFIVVGIYYALKPWGLEAIAVTLGMVLIPVQLLGSGRRLVYEGEREFERRGRPTGRVRLGLLLMGLLLGALLLTPFPRRAPALGVLRSIPASTVVCLEGGQIEQMACAGEKLQLGELVYQLHYPELVQELARLETQLQGLAAQELAIQRKRTQLTDSSEALALVAEARTGLLEQQARLLSRQQALQAQSPRAGELIPDPFRFQTAPDLMNGSILLDPLAPENRGLLLQTGDRLGRISSRDRYQVIIQMEAHWADPMLPESQAIVFIPENGNSPQAGQLLQLSSVAESWHHSPQQESAQRILQRAIEQIPGSVERSYVTGIVELPASEGLRWSDFQLCKVRIDLPPASLWQRGTEFLQRTWKRNTF